MKIPKIFRPGKKKIAVLVILILIVFWGFNTFGKKEPTPLQFTTVKKQDIKSTVSASGNLVGKNTVDLKFKASGRLAFVNVKAGDKVWQGQVLAGLDTQDLLIALQQARNTLVAKDAAAKRVEDDVKDHDKDETFLQKETRTAAQVARDNAFDAVKAAQRNFQDAIIVSPINGIVTKADLAVGQNSGDTALQVADNSNIYFDAEIDEADISNITLGQKAEITLDSYPDKIFAGNIDQIKPLTETTSTGANIIKVRIKLDKTDINFISGLSGQALIIISQARNVLTIPQESLRDDDTVVLADLNPKKVVTGIKSDIDVEIKEGLKEDDRILLNPPGQIQRQTNPLQRVLRLFGGGRPGGSR